MNIISSTGLLSYLQMHGYVIMLLMMFVEGASVTYVSAFLASTGVFNIYAVLLISILGFVTEDLILYSVGKRWGKKFLIKQFYSKLKGKTLKKITSGIKKHPGRTIAFVKLTPIIPIPGLLMIGASDVPWKKFVFYSAAISAAYSLVFTLLGFYSGVLFSVIAKGISHSDFVIVAAVLLGIGVVYLSQYIPGRITK